MHFNQNISQNSGHFSGGRTGLGPTQTPMEAYLSPVETARAALVDGPGVVRVAGWNGLLHRPHKGEAGGRSGEALVRHRPPLRSETVAPREVARGCLDTDTCIWILRMNTEAQAQLEKLKSADGAASSMNAAGVTCLDIMNIYPLTIQ